MSRLSPAFIEHVQATNPGVSFRDYPLDYVVTWACGCTGRYTSPDFQTFTHPLRCVKHEAKVASTNLYMDEGEQ